MRVVVIGACGQLGRDICEAFQDNGDEVTGFDILLQGDGHMDIVEYDSVYKGLSGQNHADLFINTAAMLNIETCENEPEKSFRVNSIGPLNLSLVCKELEKPLMHFSTDYVFDGRKKAPYTENDRPVPLSVYGNSKLSGENFVESQTEKHFVLRVSGLFGKHPCLGKGGKNFVDVMMKKARAGEGIRVVDDEIMTPTFTEDIADQVVKLAHSRPGYGLYHVTAEGFCTWYEFAGEIFSLSGSDVTLDKAAPGEFAVKASRPKYSVLENKALKDQGLNFMSHWREGLKRYLAVKYHIAN